MAGRDGSATKQAMMLVNGINPVASNKIDGIYNIEDIASTKFEMSLKILTSTGADLILNGVSASSLNPQTEQIIGGKTSPGTTLIIATSNLSYP